MSRTILMVAADAREFQGLRSRVPTRRLSWGLEYARECEINGCRAILVANGAGMRMAGVAADVARRHVSPDAVVSIGFCGATDPSLQTADVFVAYTVVDRENERDYRARLPEQAVATPGGTLLSLNRVANTAEEKQQLRAAGASAVEMEAAAVADRAKEWGVPFYCVRSVSDIASENFEIDFNRMRDGNGRFSRIQIVLAALQRPWSCIPALFKLNNSCRKASQSLGEFLANCRF